MSLQIQWRDLTKRGMAAWANQTLNERVIDLLSDIMLASEEIEGMILGESRVPPCRDFFTRLHWIYSEAASLMGNVVEAERKAGEH